MDTYSRSQIAEQGGAMAEMDDKLKAAIGQVEGLANERDTYHRLYLEERITGLTAQEKLAQVLREQAEAELRELNA